MSEEEQKKVEAGQISRREFLKDAGLVIGGATIGSMALASACAGGGETATTTTTATKTVTVTGGGATTATQTITVTSPPVTKLEQTVVDPRTVLNVNGTDYKVEVEDYWSLNFVLREKLGFISAKQGCDRGECGACMVLIDGKIVLSCLYLAKSAAGHKIVTAESMAHDNVAWDPIATAFAKNNALQCGYCTPSFMLASKALLTEYPKPTIQQVQEGLSGNLCVCSCYKKVMQAVMQLGGS